MHGLTDREFWNKVWESRGTHQLNRWNAYDARYAELFHRQIRPADRVLEAGCGGSIWLPYIATVCGAEVWGIDFAEVGVRSVEANLRAAGVPGCIILDDLLTTTRLPERFFQFVFSFGLIEHFSDPEAVVRRLSSLLVPGGRTYLRWFRTCRESSGRGTVSSIRP